MALYGLVYGRVSTLQQSIDVQVAQFEALGYDEIFLERISGQRRDRPEFLRMVARALELREQGHRVQVFVVEWTRWARDTAYSLEMLQKLEAAGVEIIKTTTGQSVTMQTPEGLLQAGMESVMAHYYSVELSAKLKRSYEHRRNSARPMAGPVPWGYLRDLEAGTYTPSPDWALCREAIERYIQGHNLSDLVRWLWAEHRLKRSVNGMRRWITNPILRGHLAYHDRTELRYDCHPALMSEAEYQAVIGRLELNRQLRGINKGRIYPVPTLVFCARCGERANTCSNKVTRYFYCYRACKRGDCDAPRKYCREDWIEAAIQNAISESAEAVADELNAPSIDPRIPAWESEIEGLLPLAHRPAIAAEIDAIRQEITHAKAAQAKAANMGQDYWETVTKLANLTPDQWAELSHDERRQVYGYLIRRVAIDGADVVRVEMGVG